MPVCQYASKYANKYASEYASEYTSEYASGYASANEYTGEYNGCINDCAAVSIRQKFLSFIYPKGKLFMKKRGLFIFETPFLIILEYAKTILYRVPSR